MRVTTVRGHTFLADGLKPGSVVVDLGANTGAFSEEVVRRFSIRCFAVEPSSQLFQGIAPWPNLRVFNFAVTDRNGPVVFFQSCNSETSSIHPMNVPPGTEAGQSEVPGRTLESFLREQGIQQVALLKVDIEGAEVQVFGPSLSNEILAAVEQITMEFHDFTGSATREQIALVVSRLRSAGFCPIRFSHTNMDWLFFRPEPLGVSPLCRLWLKFGVRNWLLLKRNLLRILGRV